MIYKKYERYQIVNSISKTLYNGDTNTKYNQHCCEFIKLDYLKAKSVILSKDKTQIEQVFDNDSIQKWIKLLKDHNLKFEYIITDKEHQIHLVYGDYNTIYELYFTMMLVRYLWYEENNHLIYRIFDILEKSKLDFFQALTIAQFYDNITRDETFNIYRNISVIKTKYQYNIEELLNCKKYSYNSHDDFEKSLDIEPSKYSNLFNSVISKLFKEKYNEDWYLIIGNLQNIINNSKGLNKLSPLDYFKKINEYLGIKVKETKVDINKLELNKEYFIDNDNYSTIGSLKKIETPYLYGNEQNYNMLLKKNKIYSIEYGN